jgi:hypothetical protein
MIARIWRIAVAVLFLSASLAAQAPPATKAEPEGPVYAFVSGSAYTQVGLVLLRKIEKQKQNWRVECVWRANAPRGAGRFRGAQDTAVENGFGLLNKLGSIAGFVASGVPTWHRKSNARSL